MPISQPSKQCSREKSTHNSKTRLCTWCSFAFGHMAPGDKLRICKVRYLSSSKIKKALVDELDGRGYR